MKTRDAVESADQIATWNGPVVPQGTPTEQQFELIRGMGNDPTTKPSDFYVFRMIASSDGVDFYATRPRVETSLKPYVQDLKQGQSLLASHDIGTLPYGSSFDGVLEEADPGAPYYEASFFRKWDRPELRTANWTIGDYFVPRGLTLNGQKTDDLIRGIQTGALRKASISFTVGGYQCSLDGQDMLDGWGTPLPNGLIEGAAPSACMHFPGLAYDGDLAYAWMDGNQMVETSMVYKNASPSALLVRKAEEMARAGMMSAAQVGRVEERLARRLPAFQRRVFASANEGGNRMTAKNRQADPPEDELDDEQSDEGKTTPTGDPAERKPRTSKQKVNVKVDIDRNDDDGSDDDEDEDETEKTESASVRQVRQMTLRQRKVAEALGIDALTIEAARGVAAEAQLGRTMYATVVDEAVKARVRAQGADKCPQAVADKYRASLTSMRDVEYALGEIEAWGGRSPFKPGRQVEPTDVDNEPTTRPPTRTPDRAGIFQPAGAAGKGN